MAAIQFYQCSSKSTYETNTSSRTGSLNVTMKDLKRYAVSVGGFHTWPVSALGVRFYEALLEMTVTEGTQFSIRDDYRKAESSIKTALSFFMGMIAAKAMAEKEYRIPYLFHLKDPALHAVTSGKTPDFFGLKNGKTALLMESKGTVRSRPSKEVINHAKDQLDAVGSVEVTIGKTKKTYLKGNLEGHVIASGFQKNNMTYYDVDPEPKGENTLKINLDREIVEYYRPVMMILQAHPTQTQFFGNEPFMIAETKSGQLGLRQEIYELFTGRNFCFSKKPNRAEKKAYPQAEGLYQRLAEIAGRYRPMVDYMQPEISMGLDGILLK